MEKTFNSKWIIELVEEQEPDRLDVIEALKKCKTGRWESRAYVYFVNQNKPNEPGSEWQFSENVVLEHETKGTIVLDLLKDGRIGGIEFLSEIIY